MSIGVIFPGQGSQSVGMLATLADEFPEVRSCYEEASAVLGYDLWAVVQAGPEEKLNQTAITQPALLAAGVAVWRVWQGENGPPARVMAGHSLGEYTALVCAEAIDFADAVRIVARRGELMQQAVPAGEGAMAAILGLEDAQVAEACAAAAQGQVVEAVNFNSPGQVVIAGHRSAVERAIEAASARRAKKAIILPVSVPSHCALMAPAAEQLAEVLQAVTIRAPKVPVIHNVDARPHSDPQAIRSALVQQLHRPVRWVEVIRAMTADGLALFIEPGPGKVLSGLGKRIERDASFLPVFDPESLNRALQSALEI